MSTPLRTFLVAASLLTTCLAARAQADEATIVNQLKTMRSLPDNRRVLSTQLTAKEIAALPPGGKKVELASALCSLTTEIDGGAVTLNAVASTLAQALMEAPPKDASGPPSEPYLELARMIRYLHAAVTPASLTQGSTELVRANAVLDHNEADVRKADFTLHTLDGKAVTLSALKGKVVLVNFWATWCPPCRKEMPDLDAIYQKYKDQGLVILAISDEDAAKVQPFVTQKQYHPVVLLDPGRKVNEMFHVEGIPQSYFYDRTASWTTWTR